MLKNFNPKNFESIVNAPFTIDASSKKFNYSELLQTNVYSFNLVLKYKSNENKKYKISYNLLAIPGNQKNYTYFIAKYYSLNSDSFSLTHDTNFSGYVNVYNKSKNLVYANKFQNGKKEMKDFFNDDFSFLNPNKYVREDGCYNATTYYYTDWYKVYPDGTRQWTSSVLTDISVDTYCSSQYYPPTGGGGTGGAPIALAVMQEDMKTAEILCTDVYMK